MPPVAAQNEVEDVAADSRIKASDSISYWSGHSRTVNSMLGGTDLRGSAAFYAKLLRKHPPVASGKPVIGVDCRAGSGRITTGFPSTVKKQQMAGKGSVGKGFVESLENWSPERVDCLKRCKDAVKMPNGWIVVKENTSKSIKDGGDGRDVYDEDDYSVTRTDSNLLKIFDDAGMNVLAQETQRGFPKSLGLFPVRTYALRPG